MYCFSIMFVAMKYCFKYLFICLNNIYLFMLTSYDAFPSDIIYLMVLAWSR